jgi:hypothetical protein
VDASGGVVTDDRVEHGAGVLVGQSGEGVGRVRRPTGAYLVVARLEPVDVGHGRSDHGQTITRRGDRSRPDLLPRHVGDHQHHTIESQGVSDVDRGDQMTDVWRVERAAEHPDVLGLVGRDGHDLTVYESSAADSGARCDEA